MSGSNPPKSKDDSLGLAATVQYRRNSDDQSEDAQITQTKTTRPRGPLSAELSEAMSDWASLAGLLRAVAATPEVAPASRLEPGTVIDETFQIECEIGVGGMGVVYLARDLKLGRRVALKLHAKVTSGEGFDRLMREATAMARLTHPNVLTVHEVGSINEQIFIAMEYVDGWNLRSWVKERRPAWPEIHQVLVAAGQGLAAAHDAGLIHRDFKPDNILIGKDGRVMVADFGLARAADPATPTRKGGTRRSRSKSTTDLDSFDSKLTVTGALMGTPAYMAPEQSAAADVDARADQFAYCVTLYEALFGQRPFKGATVTEMLDQIQKGNVREPPADRKVPRWIRDVIMRGLEVDPEARYPSMHALLDALRTDPAAARRRLLFSGGAMLGVAAIAATIGILAVRGGGTSGGGDEPVAVCNSAEEDVAAAWNNDRKRIIRDAFMGTKAATAENTWLGVRALVDGYTTTWKEHHRRACEATHVHKTQSEVTLDRRMACLERRLDSLDALLGVFEGLDDPKLVGKAITATTRLPSIALCSSRDYLDKQLKPPEDNHTATRVAALRKLKKRVQAAQRAGRLKVAIELGEKMLGEARPLGYPPILAEALHALGRAYLGDNQHEKAEKALEEAYFTARRSSHDEAAGVSASALIDLYHRTAKWKEGELWSKHAKAEAERAKDRGDMPIQVYDSIGGILAARGKFDEALEYRRKALALQRELGDSEAKHARLLSNIGASLDAKGELAKAAEVLEQSLAIKERLFGKEHPRLAATLGNLGLVYNDLGKVDRSITLQKRGLSITRANFGEGAVATGYAWLNYGVALASKPDNKNAIAAFEKAKGILVKALGKKHPDSALPVTSLGVTYEAIRQFDKSLANHREALEIMVASKGPDHVTVAQVHHNIASVLMKTNKFAEAVASYKRAIAILDKLNPNNPRISHSLRGLSTTLTDWGKGHLAIAPAERALKLSLAHKLGPLEVGKNKMILAHALWMSKRDRKRAKTMMAESRDHLAAAGEAGKGYLEYTERWLKNGGPPKGTK